MAGEFDFPASWTSLVTSQSVSDAGSYTSSALSNEGKLGTEVFVRCTYGATFDEGLIVAILHGIDGTNYEAFADAPWGFRMWGGVSGLYTRKFWVPGNASDFKIYVDNNSGASVTVDLYYRQPTRGT